MRDDPAEFAPTRVRMPSGGVPGLPSDVDLVTSGGSSLVVKPSLPRWLVVVSIACALVFAVGGLLRLFGPLPARSATPGGAAGDGAATDGARAVDTPGVEPGIEPPVGMLLVTGEDGRPLFYADKHPVIRAAYTAIFPNHEDDRNGDANRPVTGVSYAYASSYAEIRGRRLLTADEWQRAAATPGFITTRGLWEWVREPPRAGDTDDKPVQSRQGGDTRAARGGGDVTFRLSRDL